VRWVLVFAIACSSPPAERPRGTTAALVKSNVLRADYAGSEACADCHDEIYAKWAASPMRNMTREIAGATVRAPFDGATLATGTDIATMEMSAGARVIRVGDESFRVTKVVGGRYREDFVGVGDDGVERVLPATYVFETKSWRYKGYSVMVKERPSMSTNAVWSQACIACHNTLPLATLLYDELYGPSLPGYQGKLSDRVLPKSRLWTARATNDAGLSRALETEIRFLGGEPPANASTKDLLRAAAETTEDKLRADKLVEVGIGCEACHNGARAHAEDPKVLPSYAVQSSVLEMRPPPGQYGSRAQWINRTCTKCHTVLFTRYPWTWEGGERTKNPGGSTTNSGEGRDFMLGGCASAMTCTTCHDPHTADAPAAMAKLATTAGNHICTTCHADVGADLSAHTHHQTTSAGSSCVGCHMPRKNMGLDYALVRYHRIGSPNDKARVERDRPLECALCHQDKSVEELASTMDKWWGKRADRTALAALYGDDLRVNALRATLVYGKPHEQAVAIAVLGEAREQAAIALIAPHLAHDYPLVRYYALRALELITQRPVAIDVGASAGVIRPQAAAFTAR
jgi:predicted CXXCH cytochrome family protein